MFVGKRARAWPCDSVLKDRTDSSSVCVCVFQSVPVRRKAHKEGEERTEGKEAEEEGEKSSDEGFMGMTPLLQAHHAMEKMEEFVHKVSHQNTQTLILFKVRGKKTTKLTQFLTVPRSVLSLEHTRLTM